MYQENNDDKLVEVRSNRGRHASWLWLRACLVQEYEYGQNKHNQRHEGESRREVGLEKEWNEGFHQVRWMMAYD